MRKILKFKKIIIFVLTFTLLTGGLFGLFGGVDKTEAVNPLSRCPSDSSMSISASACPENPEGEITQTNLDIVREVAAGKEAQKKNLTGSPNEYGLNSWDISNPFNIPAKIAYFIYYIFYLPSAAILYITGYIFNTLLSFSLSSEIINAPFVKTAWDSFRGIANLLFILILVAISISTILDLGKYKAKDLVVKVIIIALMVNFSLFAARVVIDIGNITALGFYDAIDSPNTGVLVNKNLSVSTKNISGELIKSFNPARLISPDAFEKLKESLGIGIIGSFFGKDAFLLIVIFSIGVGINLYTSYLLFMAGWIFVVRIAYLWILMIISPLAFMAFIIPDLREYWNKWWKELFNKSFVITIFMAFLYLILLIIGDQFLASVFDPTNRNIKFFEFIAMVLLQYVLVITLLKLALSTTKKFSDDGGVGKEILGLAKGVGNLAVGYATGGVGLLASQKIGGWASKKADQVVASGGGTSRPGKFGVGVLRKIETTSFASKKAKFGKESYKARTERVEKEETGYMRSLPKKTKDASGNIIKPQERFKESIRQVSPISTVMGRRSGEESFIKEQELAKYKKDKKKALKEKLKEMRKKSGSVNDRSVELKIEQDNLDSFKEDRKKGKKVDIKGQIKQVAEKEEQLKEEREKIQEFKLRAEKSIDEETTTGDIKDFGK